MILMVICWRKKYFDDVVDIRLCQGDFFAGLGGNGAGEFPAGVCLYQYPSSASNTHCLFCKMCVFLWSIVFQELYKWALESVAVLALNTRLGCLQPDLPKVLEWFHLHFISVAHHVLPTVMPHLHQASEQERLINAVGDMFLLNGKLDDGMQLWRYSPIQGPAMRKFEATCQVKKKLAVFCQ